MLNFRALDKPEQGRRHYFERTVQNSPQHQQITVVNVTESGVTEAKRTFQFHEKSSNFNLQGLLQKSRFDSDAKNLKFH